MALGREVGLRREGREVGLRREGREVEMGVGVTLLAEVEEKLTGLQGVDGGRRSAALRATTSSS